MEQSDLFPAKSSDKEIIEILASEAETAINNTTLSESESTNLELRNQMFRSFKTVVF